MNRDRSVAAYLVFVLGPLAATGGEQPVSSRLLTTVAEVRSLALAEASQGLPVRLQGVVTYLEPDGLIAFLQDPTGGVYFKHHNKLQATRIEVEQGDLIEIRGITTPGEFAPYVIGPDFLPVEATRLGPSDWPDPVRLAPDELRNPAHHSQWIELRASIRSVTGEGLLRQLDLSTPGGQLGARVRLSEDAAWEDELSAGALVRVRGVFGSLYDDRRQLRGVRLFVPSPDFIHVEDPGGDALWTMPVRQVANLLQFEPPISVRARIRGVITGIAEGGMLFLRDDTKSIRLQTPSLESWTLGEAVDVVGIVSEDHGHAVLHDAFIRSDGERQSVDPIPLSGDAAALGRHAFELVQIEGVVVDRLIQPENHVLLLRSGERVFQAQLSGETPPGFQLPAWHSRVAVQGICLMDFRTAPASRLEADPPGEASGFSILMRLPEDIEIIQGPPFWTLKLVIWLLGGVLVILVGALVWIRMLRLRVAQQTETIRGTLRRETVLEERTRISRELHDTLEQDLAAVQLHLDTAARHLEGKPAAARNLLVRARQLLRYSRDEARRSVMDLRSVALDHPSLVAALETWFKVLHADRSSRIKIRVEGNPRRLKAPTEHNLLRITQEAVNNALDHGDAQEVVIEICYGRSQLEVAVRDDGAGFDLQSPEPAGSHFGLLGMRERAERCGGTLTIESSPGTGTTVSLILPWEPGEKGDEP